MSDWFEHEKSRYGDGDDEPSIIPIPLPVPNGDLVVSDYIRAISSGCAIADAMMPMASAEFVEKNLVPLWERMAARVNRLDESIETMKRKDEKDGGA